MCVTGLLGLRESITVKHLEQFLAQSKYYMRVYETRYLPGEGIALGALVIRPSIPTCRTESPSWVQRGNALAKLRCGRNVFHVDGTPCEHKETWRNMTYLRKLESSVMARI